MGGGGVLIRLGNDREGGATFKISKSLFFLGEMKR